MSKSDDIVKRLVKAYLLTRKGEWCNSNQICKYLNQYNFGLQKSYTPEMIGRLMSVWCKQSCRTDWFKVEQEKRGTRSFWRCRV